MPKFQINGLEMTVSSGMIGPHWTDDKGVRYHLWLRVERDPASPNSWDRRPVTPYEVSFDGASPLARNKRVLYMNCPRNADGTYKNRFDEGHFGTRYLDADAKGNAPLVAEVLRRCEAEGLYKKALEANANAEKEERIASEQKKLDRLGAAVVQLEKELNEEGNPELAKRFAASFAKLPRESMIKFHDIMMRNTI